MVVILAYGVAGIAIGVLIIVFFLFVSDQLRMSREPKSATDDYLSDILQVLESILARMPD